MKPPPPPDPRDPKNAAGCRLAHHTEAYILGELTDDARAEFEAHFFDCRSCENEVMIGFAVAEGARALAPVRARTAELPATDAGRLPAGREEDASSDRGTRAELRFIARSIAAWPRAAQVASACAVLLLVVTVVQSLVVLPRLQDELALRDQPRALAPVPLRTLEEGAVPRVVLAAQDWSIALALADAKSARGGPMVRLVRESGEDVITWFPVPAPPAGQPLELLLPAKHLQPGRHVLEVRSDEPGTAAPVARYPFELVDLR